MHRVRRRCVCIYQDVWRAAKWGGQHKRHRTHLFSSFSHGSLQNFTCAPAFSAHLSKFYCELVKTDAAAPKEISAFRLWPHSCN